MRERTVFVEEFYPNRVLKMVWQSHVRTEDVDQTFQEINDYLNATSSPICIVVDLTANPHIPMHQTVFKAITAQRHPNLQRWVVLGKNQIARIVGNSLINITNRNNIEWFTTFDEFNTYLEQMLAEEV